MNASQTAAAVWIVQSCRAVTVCFKNVGHVARAQNGDISRRRLRSWEAIPILHQPEIAHRMAENADADPAAAELRSWTAFRMRHQLGLPSNMADIAEMRSGLLPHRFEFRAPCARMRRAHTHGAFEKEQTHRSVKSDKRLSPRRQKHTQVALQETLALRPLFIVEVPLAPVMITSAEAILWRW